MNGRRARKLRRQHEHDRPPAAIIRAHLPGTEPGVDTYLALRESLAPGLVADMTGDGGTAEILGPDALPLCAVNAPAWLAGKPARTVLTIGTAAGGEWLTWHAGPLVREPVPGSPAWHAQHDQAEAARADAQDWALARAAAGARRRDYDTEDTRPPAVREMMRRFGDGCRDGAHCPHKRPDRAEVTHQFGHQPDHRLCARCAAPLLPYRAPACNLCGAVHPPGGLTVLTATVGWLLCHMAFCDTCYPGGADAPATIP